MENLPRAVKEIFLYLRQETSAFLVVAEITEITKWAKMQKVNLFVALFAPIGLFPCTIRPLVDAALDLMTSTTRQNPG